MYQRLKARALAWLADLVAFHPRLVLLVAGALVVLSLLVTLVPVRIPIWGKTLGPLGFQSNRNDLISPDLAWNQRFIHWQDNFSDTSDLIIAADSGPPGPGHEAQAAKVRALIDDLGPALARVPWVQEAVWGFDKLKVSPKAIRLADYNPAQPSDPFRRMLKEVEQSTTLLSSATPDAFIGQVLRQMQGRQNQTSEQEAISGLDSLSATLDAFSTSLANDTPKPTDLNRVVVEREQTNRWQYLVSDNGRLYFIRISPKLDKSQLNAMEPAIDSVRKVLAEVSARHPGVAVGLTGIDVVEADETAAATWDGLTSSILAAVLITTVMILAYHSVRMPLMHTTSLLVAIAWTFGFTTVAVGHLQVISVIFVPLLLALGIAYGIYLTSRFELIRHNHPDDPAGYAAAMRDTYQIMGPGVITGCFTTAAAFMMTLLTKFTGVAEMGLIAGVGVLLCLISMLTVFPAMVRLIKPAHKDIVPLEKRPVRFYKDRWIMPMVRHPRLTLAVGAVVTAVSLFSLRGMTFDYNLLKLQPRGMPSVEWERRIVEDAGESIWFGVSVVPSVDQANKLPVAQAQKLGMEQARALVKKYREQPTVGVVRGVGLLMPQDDRAKIKLLEAARPGIEAAIAQGNQAPRARPGLPAEVGLSNLVFAAQANRPDVPAAVKPHLAAVGQSLAHLATVMASLPPQELKAHLARLDQEFATWRQDVEAMVLGPNGALNTSPLDLSDLPKAIIGPYISKDGKQLSLEIFPRLPNPATSSVRDVLDPQFLPVFIHQMQSVDPNVTGVAVQIYESGRLIENSYTLAGALGMGVVFLILLFDFQSLRDALLALVPVIVGFAVSFGIMRLVGMTINAANIIVLPLMFGIGVDSGVHLIYRSRMDPDGQPPGLTQGTGVGVVLVNMTTIIGFGVLAIPYISWLHIGVRHRGIQSLGFVLTCGMAMTLLACLTVMPAWLELRRRARQRRA